MIEIRNNFSGGLDQDSSYYALGKNVYVDALNITLDSIVSGSDRVISNMVGNRLISYTFPSGNNTCIGAVANAVRNTVISFVYNTNSYHSIVEYNLTTRTASKIFENLTDSASVDILGFTLNDKITGINVYNRDEGDLLFFLDSLGRPTFLNIEFFKTGVYTPVTRQIIDVAVNWPSVPPSSVYGNDAATVSNYLNKKLFRFKYRWVFDDNFKSPYSPISALSYPVNVLNPAYTNIQTNNNIITVSSQSGPKNVKGVELAVSIQNNSNIFGRFQTVKYFDKTVESISDDSSFAFNFYNDSTYPFVSDEESLLLYSYVPQTAKSQEMPNGNVLCYGGILEGYDKDLVPNVVTTINTVAAGSGIVVGSLLGVPVTSPSSIRTKLRITFFGTPAVGTVINVNISSGGTLLGAYTTVSGDTSTSVAAAIAASYNSIGLMQSVSQSGGQVDGFFPVPSVTFTLTITPPTVSATQNSIATWPFSGQRQLGIVYYDEKGRTNGVIYNEGITFPGYAENGSQQVLLPYINIKIYHVPPIWAYSYQIVFTKDETPFLYLETVDVKNDTNYLYFDITNLGLNQRKNPTTEAVVSWSFQDGDRVRLIRKMSDNTVYGEDYDSGVEGIVVAPSIGGVTQTDKTFIKISKSAPFAALDYSSKFYIVQLYRPTQQEPNNENATYYECGVQFPILDPTTADRRHGGQVTDQSVDLVTPAEIDVYSGDVYFRVRQEYLSDTGVGTFYVQDRNFVDFVISAVSNIDGRPSAIEINAKETYFPAMVRYSQAYQASTVINRLNIFLPASFEEYDYSYGDIMRLKCRDRLMRVYQKLKIGVVYLFNQIQKNPVGNSVTVTTDKLLNPIQYYIYNGGIGENAESLASFNFADYCTNNINGSVLRISNDGVTVISVAAKMNAWATDNIPLRTGNYKIYGAYEQKLNNYIIALEEVPGTSDAQTLSFSEAEEGGDHRPCFESFLSYHPEMMVSLGTLLMSFKDGQLWTHDNTRYNSFYGTDYESYVTAVFNDNPYITKQPMAITEMTSNGAWDCPAIVAQSNSYGNTAQESNLVLREFASLEGKWVASVKRDINSRGGKVNGNFLKGNYFSVKFRKATATDLVTLNIVSMKVNESPLNTR